MCYRIVVLGAILPNLFLGWVTSSATAITYTLGINTDLYRPIAIGLLVTVGLVVTVSPVIYNDIERVEMVLVSVILIFLVFAKFISHQGFVSPITGEEEATPGLGYTFPTNEENMRRWRGWWKVANMEQGILFFGIGLISLIALSVLANSTIGVQPGLPADLEFIREEAVVLGTP